MITKTTKRLSDLRHEDFEEFISEIYNEEDINIISN